MEAKTLKEWGVKPGDVVQFKGPGSEYTVKQGYKLQSALTDETYEYAEFWDYTKFNLISRANTHPVNKVVKYLLVPGNCGHVTISKDFGVSVSTVYKAEDIRDAIEILTEIAEALEENT